MTPDSTPPDIPGERQDSTRTVPMMAASPGAEIGPYKLVRQLGEGGMGVVYHAQQIEPIRRDVALKIIKPGMDSKQVIRRFESERQALAMMDHANIARVFDAGTTPTGLPYFAMELVAGVPIIRYCDTRRLTLKERIELFIPVCRAIQHAHQKGILHRDIKPSNVLVAEQDGKPLPKVIDFGLAKALGHQLNDVTLMTNLGTVVGTLEYMSPEQAEIGRHDIDTRSDIYSLGVVLYELLTGTTPLEHASLVKAAYLEILQRIREEEVPAPSARMRQSTTSAERAAQRRSDPAQLPKLLHGELDWITMKALEKDRARRYETANGLTRDLERYIAGEPVEAAPPSTAYRLRKFVRKNRVWLSVAAGFAALLVAGVVVSTWMALRASRAEQTAQAVNDFLQNDVLAQASAENQAGKPDRDLKVRTALDRAAAGISGKFSRQPQVEAAIRDTIGQTYLDLGLYPEARTQLERAVELHRRELGAEHPATLRTVSRMGRTAFLQGKYPEAEALFSRNIEIQRRVLGPEHIDVLASMSNLGLVYYSQGKYAEAETLYGRTLELQRRVLGPEHTNTLNSMENLAFVYSLQGKHAQAEVLFEQTLEIRRRVQGPEHPKTLASMNNLGTDYQRQGKYAQAEALYRQANELQRRVLGPEHPYTINSAQNLATVYGAQGKSAQAEPLFQQTLEIQRRVLGPEHPDTIHSMGNLADAYVFQSKYAQAEALFAATLELSRRVLGPEHPRTLIILADLAGMYQRQGRYASAETNAAQALAGRRHRLGSEHPATIAAAADLALVYQSEGKFVESEPLAHEVLEFYRKKNPDDWQLFRAESLLGASLAGQKKYAEAEPLLLEGYQGMAKRKDRIIGPDEYHLDRAQEWLVQLYQDWGKREKAAEWRKKIQTAATRQQQH